MGSLELSSGWLLVITALLIYCAVQTFRDFRRHRYLMAGVGVFCLALILLPSQKSGIRKPSPSAMT